MTSGCGNTDIAGDVKEGALSGGVEAEACSKWGEERMGDEDAEARMGNIFQEFYFEGEKKMCQWMDKEVRNF